MCETHFCWLLLSPNCTIDMSATAAWLQAAGTLGALFLTNRLYKNQIEQNRIDKQHDYDEKRKAQALVANHFADTALDIFDKCAASFGFPNQHDRVQHLRNVAHYIDDIIVWSRIFVIDTFSQVEMSSFLHIRKTLHEISIYIKNGDAYEVSVNQKYIYDSRDECNAALVNLLKAK